MKRPTPNSRGERSRVAIVEAATLVFADEGYRGASLATIAAAANLTQPGLLHHFPSKEDLLLRVLEDHYHEDGRVVGRALGTGGLELIAALDTLIAQNAEAPVHARLLTVLVAEALAESHPAHAFFVSRYRRVRQAMRDALLVGQARGDIDASVDADELAVLLVAVMDGIQTQWLLDPEIDMTAAFRAFVAMVRVPTK